MAEDQQISRHPKPHTHKVGSVQDMGWEVLAEHLVTSHGWTEARVAKHGSGDREGKDLYLAHANDHRLS